MEVLHWVANHWFELLQTFLGGGIVFFAYSIRKDTRARRITNLIAINGERREAWEKIYEYPELERVLSKDANIKERPVSTGEELFVTSLILHLNTAYQAMNHGEFITLEGLQRDVQDFFSLPIPRSVWEQNKRLQNSDFVEFVEKTLK